jgi:hypothetical protein
MVNCCDIPCQCLRICHRRSIDPVPRCARPPPRPGEADITIIVGRADHPSSIVAPNQNPPTTIPLKRTGDGAAGDLTIMRPAAAAARAHFGDFNRRWNLLHLQIRFTGSSLDLSATVAKH